MPNDRKAFSPVESILVAPNDARIRTDVYFQREIQSDQVDKIVRAIKAGETIQAIVLGKFPNDSLCILDGLQRFTAAGRCGYTLSGIIEDVLDENEAAERFLQIGRTKRISSDHMVYAARQEHKFADVLAGLNVDSDSLLYDRIDFNQTHTKKATSGSSIPYTGRYRIKANQFVQAAAHYYSTNGDNSSVLQHLKRLDVLKREELAKFANFIGSMFYGGVPVRVERSLLIAVAELARRHGMNPSKKFMQSFRTTKWREKYFAMGRRLTGIAIANDYERMYKS